ncbi:MAG TPA: FAD-binding oxidoreductase [Pirellulales bacterium]|nr:FAD-binding oxidoreductase [Pirellulales bacterium]
MAATTFSLPLTATTTPADQTELAEAIRAAYEQGEAVYPLGGGTSLDYGLPPKTPGRGITLKQLNRVVDYPARDTTITVEAGTTVAALATTLATERQWLPIDVPHAERATLGGVVATAVSGPRRYGQGTIRDYVIGISAVDGCGRPFKAGGRVVKNVAGYDFCKLLSGSLGTLAAITQLTFKLKPLAEASALLACDLPDLLTVERLLAALVTSRTTPTAIELLAGESWQSDPALPPFHPEAPFRIVVGIEGSASEVAWMQEQLSREWTEQGMPQPAIVPAAAVRGLWQRLTAFQTGDRHSGDGDSAVVVKFNVPPSRLCRLVEQLLKILPTGSLQAHAGNGIIFASVGSRPVDLQGLCIHQLQPAALSAGGRAVVWANPLGEELTRQAYWGGAGADVEVMRAVKRQFDPRNLLNPGRFVYGT